MCDICHAVISVCLLVTIANIILYVQFEEYPVYDKIEVTEWDYDYCYFESITKGEDYGTFWMGAILQCSDIYSTYYFDECESISDRQNEYKVGKIENVYVNKDCTQFTLEFTLTIVIIYWILFLIWICVSPSLCCCFWTWYIVCTPKHARESIRNLLCVFLCANCQCKIRDPNQGGEEEIEWLSAIQTQRYIREVIEWNQWHQAHGIKHELINIGLPTKQMEFAQTNQPYFVD